MARLKLLGGAALEADDGAVHPLSSRRHPIALLALLASTATRKLGRSRLVGLLWPDVTEHTARNRLSSCVYQVRSTLGGDVLQSVGDELRLDAGALPCDASAFAAAVEAGDHARAAALYTGPFLDGFVLDGTAEFEHWLDRERERLRRGHQRALEALAEEAAARGDAAAAAHWWRERTVDDAHDTRAALRLVEALAAAGDPAEALRAAEAHARRFEEDLGARPRAELQRAIDRLRASSSPSEPPATEARPVRSIAVLPFENLGGQPEAEPFAAGLHEDLLTELSRFPGLTVISRTSVLRYRNTDRPLREIARELGVGTVVEGAVQAAAGRVRFNVQLIDARTDAHRWVERYDRALSTDSIFDIQIELASKIAATLHAELASPERVATAGEPAGNLQAYRLYVQGRGLLDQRTRHEMFRAIDYFRGAIDRDPGFALAWSGLADALSLLEFYDYPPPPGAPDPVEAARRAVDLAPASGPAHGSLGTIRSIRQDGPGALRELEAAIELAPSYAEAHIWLAWLHLLRGHPKRALDPARRAVALDPLAPAFRAYLAETWLALAEPLTALREADRGCSIQPEYGLAHYMRGLVLYHLGRLPDSTASLETALSLVPRSGTPSHAEIQALLGVIAHATGDVEGVRARMAAIGESGHTFSTGLLLAALGDTDAAFDAFAGVRDWRSFSTEHFRYFFPHVLGPLREDPRYRRILADVDRRWCGEEPIRH